MLDDTERTVLEHIRVRDRPTTHFARLLIASGEVSHVGHGVASAGDC